MIKCSIYLNKNFEAVVAFLGELSKHYFDEVNLIVKI